MLKSWMVMGVSEPQDHSSGAVKHPRHQDSLVAEVRLFGNEANGVVVEQLSLHYGLIIDAPKGAFTQGS